MIARGQSGHYRQRVAVQLTILGSGSSGNCAYLETDETRLLIDAGFSLRQDPPTAGRHRPRPEGLSGILITHEHTDHINGLGRASKLKFPIYCNRLTQARRWNFSSSANLTAASSAPGRVLRSATSRWTRSRIPHDASDPVGFLFSTPGGNIGFLTDLGHATKLALQRVRAANVLRAGNEPRSENVAGIRRAPGAQAAHRGPPRASFEYRRRRCRPGNHVRRIAATFTSGISAANATDPELAHRVMRERLQKIGAHHVKIRVDRAKCPLPHLASGTRARLLAENFVVNRADGPATFRHRRAKILRTS